MDFSKPSCVIDRLNRTFQMKDHAGKFFSVWYGVYSRSARQVTYANAGHPPALLQRKTNGTQNLTKTVPGGPVLGIMPEITAPETTIDFLSSDELYLFTDGLYELTDPKGGHGSYNEFLAYLETQAHNGKPTWEAMLQWHQQARNRQAIDDDVTLFRFTVES